MAAKKPAMKSKPVSKGQASAVAAFLKSQKTSTDPGEPKVPTAAKNPVVDADDDDE